MVCTWLCRMQGIWLHQNWSVAKSSLYVLCNLTGWNEICDPGSRTACDDMAIEAARLLINNCSPAISIRNLYAETYGVDELETALPGKPDEGWRGRELPSDEAMLWHGSYNVGIMFPNFSNIRDRIYQWYGVEALGIVVLTLIKA